MDHQNIKSLSRRKHQFYNQAKVLNTNEAWVDYKELKRLTQQECCKAYNHFITNQIRNQSSKKFGHSLKQKKPNVRFPHLFVNDGFTHTDDLTKTNVLNNQLTSVLINGHTLCIPKLQGIPYPTIQSIQIHQDGVIQLMQHVAIDYSKTYDPDKIPGCLLKKLLSKYPLLLHYN